MYRLPCTMNNFNNLDSEEETVPVKKAKATTPSSSAKKSTPGKSAVSSKMRQKTIQQPPPKTKKESVTLTDFFGSAPIKRTPRPSSSHSGSKPPSQNHSRASSEVVVVPESPVAAEEGVVGEGFEDVAIAMILQEEELEKAKLEVRCFPDRLLNGSVGPFISTVLMVSY